MTAPFYLSRRGLRLMAVCWAILGGVIGLGALTMAVPDWRAAHGLGRTGTFTLTEPQSCDRWPPPRQRCGWFGDFVSGDGSVVRHRVDLAAGLPAGAAVGDIVAARDAGSLTTVYQLGDRQTWKQSAGFSALGFGACVLGLLVLEPWTWRRRR